MTVMISSSLIGGGDFLGLLVTAWLFLYKLISLVGASNAVLASLVNYIGTATLGFAVLNEPISPAFVLGAVLLMVGVLLTFRIQSDASHRKIAPLKIKLLLLIGMAVAYSTGMMFEKQAIDSMGAWEYMRYGWGMQFVVAALIMFAMGRSEFAAINRKLIRKAATLGVVTSVAGGLFVLALSYGTLIGTTMATSAKVALTSVLAYVFLNERNNLRERLAALALALLGMWFILLEG